MFCPDCSSLMDKSTETGEIQFTCVCSKTVAGGPNDTLMSEQVLVAANDTIKYADMIKNAIKDNAQYREFRKCPKCPMPFMTSIRVGINETVYYLCSGCQYTGSREEYLAQSGKK